VRTAIVEFGARRAARADGADDLVAKLDHHAATEKHDMRQLGKRSNRILSLGALSQSECIVFERNSGVCLIVGAIERVNAGAVAAQRHNDGAISVEHNCSFTVALSVAQAATVSFAASTASAAGIRCVGKVSAQEVDALINDPAAVNNIF
jgi:hypothetical protein